MKNVNMVKHFIEMQKQGVKIFLTPEGLEMILGLVKTQANEIEPEQKVG